MWTTVAGMWPSAQREKTGQADRKRERSKGERINQLTSAINNMKYYTLP